MITRAKVLGCSYLFLNTVVPDHEIFHTGNTCDDANDPNGCIFTQNLLVPDVTADEINAAVGNSSASGASESSASATVAAEATATAVAAAGR